MVWSIWMIAAFAALWACVSSRAARFVLWTIVRGSVVVTGWLAFHAAGPAAPPAIAVFFYGVLVEAVLASPFVLVAAIAGYYPSPSSFSLSGLLLVALIPFLVACFCYRELRISLALQTYLHAYAKGRGGRCLTGVKFSYPGKFIFTAAKSPSQNWGFGSLREDETFRWRCSRGHEWKATPKFVLGPHWVMTYFGDISQEKVQMVFRSDLNDLIREFKDFDAYKDGNWCPHCDRAVFGRHYIDQVVKSSRCQCCEMTHDPALLDVHHVDGDPSNNAKDNLRVLCRACHSAIPFHGKDTPPTVLKDESDKSRELLQTFPPLPEFYTRLPVGYKSPRVDTACLDFTSSR